MKEFTKINGAFPKGLGKELLGEDEEGMKKICAKIKDNKSSTKKSKSDKVIKVK
jgi:hypothetical protein